MTYGSRERGERETPMSFRGQYVHWVNKSSYLRPQRLLTQRQDPEGLPGLKTVIVNRPSTIETGSSKIMYV